MIAILLVKFVCSTIIVTSIDYKPACATNKYNPRYWKASTKVQYRKISKWMLTANSNTTAKIKIERLVFVVGIMKIHCLLT